MPEATVGLLTAWQPFYGIIGAAAATLTGLMFVVVTLTSSRIQQQPRGNEVVSIFTTPSVLHFGAALLVAAILIAPWPVLWNASMPLGLCGLGGVIYMVIVLLRMHRQSIYQPVLEDWLWHTGFPLTSYTALVVAALMLPGYPTPALFISGAATVLLLFIGIHNAWDSVTYITLMRPQSENKPQDQ